MPAGILENITDPPAYATDQAGASLYLEGPGIVNSFDIESGVCILPIAESPPDDPTELAAWSPVAVLKLHSPFRTRRVKFATKKQLAPPVLPAPGDAGAFVFTSGTLEFTNTPNSVNGYDWICGVEYEYVENCVSRTVDGFVLGLPAFQTNSQAAAALLIGGTPNVPPFGAIAQAGADAKVGYILGQQINSPLASGPYAIPSYFPGTLFNDELMNASYTQLTSTSILTTG